MTAISRVERRKVIVESVLGFHLVQELLGCYDAAVCADEDDAMESDDTSPSPATRIARALVELFAAEEAARQREIFGPDPDDKSSWNNAAKQGEGWDVSSESYVPVGWCEQQEWGTVALAPASCSDEELELAPAAAAGGGSEGHMMQTAAGPPVLYDVQLLCLPDVTMVPDMRWVRLLNSANNAAAGLLKTNALLSTLGGGRFLCRQVSEPCMWFCSCVASTITGPCLRV